jgi:hypothetical protein
MTRLPGGGISVETAQLNGPGIMFRKFWGPNKMLPKSTETEIIFPVRVERAEYNFNCFPNNTVHVCGTRGEHGGIVE